MRMSYALNLQQTQKLIMTPELRQAITILQMGAMDLTDYIADEVMQNPLLESKEEPAEESAQNQDTPETLDWLEYFNDSSDTGYIPRWRDEDRSPFDYFVPRGPTLNEYLLDQLCLSVFTGREREIGEFLIGNIDENGYLRCTLDDVVIHLGYNMDEVTGVLNLIQSFDPVGVGARDLKECLLLQMEYLECNNAPARIIISDYLEDLAAGRYTRIANEIGCCVQDVQKAADLIRTLDPKPGRRFAGADETNYVIPDAVVERVCGEYVVIVNDSMLPRLTISPFYRRLLMNEAKDGETRKFLENRFNSALWLLKSIEQRRLTLYRVMESIVKIQREFFDYGTRHLKPMTLRQVADMIGVHESTVSRAVANKYAQTPHGVFSMRSFFNSGVASTGGGSISSKAIKKMIEEMIRGESTSNPLSDQKIAMMFAKRGISISRRTVTKYREELGISSSARRKRY
ncbi:MAG: RNA polymerase factor sigma-54 [Firmicutes bacterium]|nr:RNA polymerase factor sigma-54 [Bacillota bacterium]